MTGLELVDALGGAASDYRRDLVDRNEAERSGENVGELRRDDRFRILGEAFESLLRSRTVDRDRDRDRDRTVDRRTEVDLRLDLRRIERDDPKPTTRTTTSTASVE